MDVRPSHESRNQLTLWIYVPLWLFFVYLFWQILSFNQASIDNLFLGGLYFILFGVHEAAHIVFMFLPQVAVAASGSLSEIGFTSLVTLAALRAKAYFAAIFGMLWMMLAMASAGNYMKDARAQAMPLIGPSENPQHDWHFVFSQLGWLQNDIAIGGGVRTVGVIIGAIGITLGFILIIRSVVLRYGN